MQKLLDGFKSADYALTSILQGQTDRNHIYANIGKVNLSDGTSFANSGILIQQGAIERAGAMRAQQVTDLNTARKNFTELQKQIDFQRQVREDMSLIFRTFALKN